MSSSLGSSSSSSIKATNALYLSGLIFDLISALTAFLAARWFLILLPEEKELLEECFEERIQEQSSRSRPTVETIELGPPALTPPCHPKPKSVYTQFLSLSLFSSFLMLVTGVLFLLVGLELYIWATQPLIVACVVSVVYLSLAPFVAGIFLIGDDRARRARVIASLSWWCRHSDCEP